MSVNDIGSRCGRYGCQCSGPHMRVMKARHASCCGICGGWMNVGTRIAEAEPRVWAHLNCVLKLAGLAPTGTS